MLDADTKRRIDTARDILVGKVPDPKSQVEQITIALIYKFMDAETAELGGDRCLFYAHAPRLVCSDHLNGVDSDRLDFRVNAQLLRE
jgi:hypothetical protein